ncbi:TolB family protein [candidate division KSB1 bacterium]
MKNNHIVLILLLSTVLLFLFCTEDNNFPVLKGKYLGQKPPGMTPNIFAPGIISTGYHDGSITFSPDGTELFYHFGKLDRMVILYMKQEGGRWTAPQVASFSGKYRDGEPHFSYDGSKLLFRSTRPPGGIGEPMEYPDIWFVERSGDGWGEPKNAGPLINTAAYDLYPTISKSGDLYFASDRDGGWDIYTAKHVNGELAEPKKLSGAINSEFGDWDAYLAPDESYMIFGSNGRPDGLGESDLYISFKKEDGTWTRSKNMGSQINTSYREVDPYISPDGKYIFFRSNRKVHKSFSESPLTYDDIIKILNNPGNGEADIYWMDARVVEGLRPGK